MIRRVVVAVMLVVVVGATWMAGATLREWLDSRHLTPLPGAGTSGATEDVSAPVHGTPASSRPSAATPDLASQVEVIVGSDDVPGCHAEGAPFLAEIRSQWGAKWSENTVVYRWARAPEPAGAITIRVEGQRMQTTLEPGERFPQVDLNLPLGTETLTLPVTTFVFERWDDHGRACFRWQSPPGTPRAPTPVPTPLDRT